MPAPITPFLGREVELAAALDFLRQGQTRLLTLTGPDGVGKTRLALRIAEEMIDGFAGRVEFIALAPIRDADSVVSTIAEQLGVR